MRHGTVAEEGAARWRVKSMNWSGSTMSSGAISSRIEPTADTDNRYCTPSDFIA